MASKVFTIKSDTLTKGLQTYFKKAGITVKGNETAYTRAKQKVGLQLLNFVVNGSSREPTVPPIRMGILRASGSVFVDGELIGDTKGRNKDGTPCRDYKTKKDEIVVGFNTAYAAKLHETTWVPGGKTPSSQAQKNPGMLANVGNKFVERHLKADGPLLLELFARIFKAETGA